MVWKSYLYPVEKAPCEASVDAPLQAVLILESVVAFNMMGLLTAVFPAPSLAEILKL